MTAVAAAPTLDASSGVVDLALDAPLPDLHAIPALGARCLVRDAGRPIGWLDLGGEASHLDGGDLADRLDAAGLAAVPARGPRPRPSATEDSVTVVIATRDRPDALARCIASVRAGRPAPAAIVVVDNAPSDDRTQTWCEGPGRRHGDLTYVREPRPGLGRAHNTGLAEVRTDLVAFTDDDVVVDPAWVGSIAAAFEATPHVACVTGLIAPAELRTPEQWWVERGTGFAKGFDRRVRTLRDRTDEGALFPYDAGTLGSGANMAFRVDALRSLGGFDPSLGTGTRSLGGDDLDALHRVVAAGHDLVYEPAAVVFHPHHDHRAALERQARGYGAGLGAYLASLVVRRPATVLDLVRRAPAGCRRLVGRSSAINARRPDDYPRALVRRERLAVLTGPPRYLAQRLQDRRLDRRAR